MSLSTRNEASLKKSNLCYKRMETDHLRPPVSQPVKDIEKKEVRSI